MKKIKPIITIWDGFFVNFAAAFLLVESSARKSVGKATFDKTRKPIKDWCIPRAFEIHKLHPSYSKEQITMQLVFEMKDKKWDEGVTPLTDTNARNTMKNDWLPKGKPKNWHSVS